jgi:hypothetical protein
METIFKEGDRVFHYHYGWGTIRSISNDDRARYPVPVNFDTSDATWFTCDGRELDCEKPSLSFTEYTLEGFSQERPEPSPKLGDIVWGKSFNTTDWSIGHYLGKQHASYKISSTPNALSYWLADKITTKNPYANEQ